MKLSPGLNTLLTSLPSGCTRVLSSSPESVACTYTSIGAGLVCRGILPPAGSSTRNNRSSGLPSGYCRSVPFRVLLPLKIASILASVYGASADA